MGICMCEYAIMWACVRENEKNIRVFMGKSAYYSSFMHIFMGVSLLNIGVYFGLSAR